MCVCCENGGCEGDGSVGMGSGRAVVAMSVYMGGTRGSDVLSSAGDVLEMRVVRGVGRVCDMCLCLARSGVAGVGGEWVRELGLGGTWGRWDMCLCFGCGGVGVLETVTGRLGSLWRYIYVCCESELFVLMAGPVICILC